MAWCSWCLPQRGGFRHAVWSWSHVASVMLRRLNVLEHVVHSAGRWLRLTRTVAGEGGMPLI